MASKKKTKYNFIKYILGAIFALLVLLVIIGSQLPEEPTEPIPQSTCGDSVCADGETCSSCEVDCGRCENKAKAESCGNGICDSTEQCWTPTPSELGAPIFDGNDAPNCYDDCGQCESEAEYCGDGTCDEVERCWNPLLSTTGGSGQLPNDGNVAPNCYTDCKQCDAATFEDLRESIVLVTSVSSIKLASGEEADYWSRGTGVIIYSSDEYMMIYTNRGEIDCFYVDDCTEVFNQNFKVRTQDGKQYEVTSVTYLPHNIDVAILRVTTPFAKQYKAATVATSFGKGDGVITMEYEAIENYHTTPQLKSAGGTILVGGSYNLPDGSSIASIGHRAYLDRAGSGGILWNEAGELLGLNIYEDYEEEYRVIAFEIQGIRDLPGSPVLCAKNYHFKNYQCLVNSEQGEIVIE